MRGDRFFSGLRDFLFGSPEVYKNELEPVRGFRTPKRKAFKSSNRKVLGKANRMARSSNRVFGIQFDFEWAERNRKKKEARR